MLHRLKCLDLLLKSHRGKRQSINQNFISHNKKPIKKFQKRVSRGKRHYFWTGISDSPFTLVVSIPENYGRHRITPPPTDDIHRLSLTSKNISARQYLSDKWSVHPDWYVI